MYWLYAFFAFESKVILGGTLYGNHHATFSMPKNSFFSICVTPFFYATAFHLFTYGHSTTSFHQICLILRKCNKNKKQFNVSLPFSYIPWHWLKIMKHDFNTLRIRSTNLKQHDKLLEVCCSYYHGDTRSCTYSGVYTFGCCCIPSSTICVRLMYA